MSDKQEATTENIENGEAAGEKTAKQLEKDAKKAAKLAKLQEKQAKQAVQPAAAPKEKQEVIIHKIG